MNREEAFREHLENMRKESTAQKYSRAIVTISEELIRYNLIDRSIYSIDDANIVYSLVDTYLSVPDLQEKDTRGKRMYSNALKRYREFYNATF